MVHLVVVSAFVSIALAGNSIVAEWVAVVVAAATLVVVVDGAADVVGAAVAAVALDSIHIELLTLKSYF